MQEKENVQQKKEMKVNIKWDNGAKQMTVNELLNPEGKFELKNALLKLDIADYNVQQIAAFDAIYDEFMGKLVEKFKKQQTDADAQLKKEREAHRAKIQEKQEKFIESISKAVENQENLKRKLDAEVEATATKIRNLDAAIEKVKKEKEDDKQEYKTKLEGIQGDLQTTKVKLQTAETDLTEKTAELNTEITTLTDSLKQVIESNNAYVESTKTILDLNDNNRYEKEKVLFNSEYKTPSSLEIAEKQKKQDTIYTNRLQAILQKSDLLARLPLLKYNSEMTNDENKEQAVIEYNKAVKELDEINKGLEPKTEGGKRNGGKRNYMKWRYVNAPVLFGGYKRDSLNKLAKKWGMENPKFYKKKDSLMKMMHFIMFAKYGDVVKRKHLNVVAKIVGINQKKYKKKAELLNAIQVKSKNVNFKIRGGKRRTKKN